MHIKLITLSIALFLVGCIGKAPILDQKDDLSLSIVQKLIDSDSAQIYINAELPNRVAVFKKKSNQFEAEMQILLTVVDLDAQKQVLRKSWNELITESYYEKTRSKSKKIKIVNSIQIEQGNYKIFLKVEDIDSHRSWNGSHDIYKENQQFISNIIAVKLSNNQFEPVLDRFDLQSDTLYLQCQIFDSTSISDRIVVKSYYDDILIDSLLFKLNVNPPFKMYQIPVYPRTESYKSLQFELSYKNQTRKINVPLKGVLSKYWSYDLNEVVAVMNYILTMEEIKILDELDIVEKEKFIDAYWLAKTPNPNLDINPVLQEFNKRVQYVNSHFSIMDKGWRTDMGRVYIKYGLPQSVENQYNDREGYRLQIWHYNFGKQFVFIDRNLFGHYVLYREIN